MDEISNKTLATLLVVAIVISLAGTFFAMRGVSQVTNYISGAQSLSESGTARVNISELTQITLQQVTVDFGTGYRNASDVDINTECNITTNQTDTADADTDSSANPNCWIATSAFDPDPFLLENTGSNYVNITINSSTADTFLNDTQTLGGTEYYGWVASDSSGGLYPSGENGCNTTFANADWLQFDNTEQLLCGNMSPFSSENEVTIDIQLGITAGLLGEKETSVIFAAEKSAQ